MIPAFTIEDLGNGSTWDGTGTVVYLNPINVVAIEPARVVLFAYDDEWKLPVACSRIVTNADTGTHTHKNDSYSAWRYGLPEVETRGGGCVEYLVPLDQAAVAEALRAGNPVHYSKETLARIVARNEAKGAT